MLTTDEETGGFNGVQPLIEKEKFKAKCVFIPDSAENFGICVDEKGLIHLTIETTGISSHGSRPWLGENAIEHAFNIYQEIKNLLEKKYGTATTDENWKPSINISTLKGGLATNIVSNKALVQLDIRFPSSISTSELKTLIQPIIKKHRGKLINILEGNSLHTEKTNTYVQSWIKVLKNNNIQPYWIKGHGASDGRYFSKEGMPVFLYKPVASASHIKDEWVDWDSLVQFKDIIKQWLMEITT